MQQQVDVSRTQPSIASAQLSTRTALILYGSETGNAHDVADEIARTAQQLYFDALVLPFDAVQLRDILKFHAVIFVVATTGQGEFPQNARSLWKTLLSGVLRPGVLRKLRFASFGLGDSSYPKYNVAHRMLHGRLLQLGAKTFCERGEGNEQHPEGHSAGLREWVTNLRAALALTWPLPGDLQPLRDDVFIEPRYKLQAAAGDKLACDASTSPLHDDSPPSAASLSLTSGIVANITENQRLTPEDHFQDVRLLDLRLQKQYEYGPGAVAVIFPKNFPKDVQQFIDLMDWQDIADQPLELIQTFRGVGALEAPSPLQHLHKPETSLTIRWLLENVLDFMSIPRRSFFGNLAHFASEEDDDHAYQKERLLELANPELIDELWDYTTRPKRTILEVMMDFTTIKIPWQYALSTLPIMRGRQFSIASGGQLRKDDQDRTRVQLLVAIVDPPSPIIKWRRRYGICTRYITSLKPGQQIDILMQPGYLNTKPADLASPAIMIGPGTGVAPMRSMIYERRLWAQQTGLTSRQRAPVCDILFFGCRSSKADHFFHDEWRALGDQAHLKVFTAFSRDVEYSRQYVQDQILENRERIIQSLLGQGAKIYVCGSSGNMPKGVRAALIDVLKSHEDIGTDESAEQYLEQLEREGRYKQETW